MIKQIFFQPCRVVTVSICLTLLCLSCSPPSDSNRTQEAGRESTAPDPLEGKKILYVNSYHKGLPWSDGIESGIRDVLNKTGVEYKIHYMDTKRNTEPEFAVNEAIKARERITAFKPDLLITSDDNAFHYLVEKYYKNAALPVVFCGVNWDIGKYGGPYDNTAGMIEVVLYAQSLRTLLPYAGGNRIGFLAEDTVSEYSNAENLKSYTGFDLIETVFVDNFDSWQQRYVQMQEHVDILVISVMGSFIDWKDTRQKQAVIDFVMDNTRIPTVTDHKWMVEFTLMAYGKIAREQGEWSASSALKILKGKPVKEVGVVRNRKGELAINLKLAEKLGILFPAGIIKNAKIYE